VPPVRYNSCTGVVMRAVSRSASRAGGIFPAAWVIIAMACLACEGGGAGGPGVEPPFTGDGINASTSGTGGTAVAGEGTGAVSGTPGETDGQSAVDGVAGTTPAPGGEGGTVDVGGGDGAGATGEGGAGIGGEAGAAAEPEATIGCRAPQEQGCEQCCETATGADGIASCVVRSASSGGDWYNAVESLDEACPQDCPPCAACSLRDEEQLTELEARSDCACDSIVVGIDPCFAPMSCECFCQGYSALAQACPHLVQ